MKETLLLIILGCLTSFSYGKEITTDRTGYHTGLGGSIVVSNEDQEVLPVVNLSLEFGLTPQSTVVLEHHGYLIAGFTALEYKYYVRDNRDTFYWMGGVGAGHIIDYAEGVVSKIGLGYAWNHLESDIFVVLDKEIEISGLSLRYKF